MTDPEEDIADYRAGKLGAPPLVKAAANRMSPAGIPMFYGSSDVDTAVAEIGTHSDKTHAIVGRFEPARELKVVDLTNLPERPSIFGGDADLYHQVVFLQQFIKDVTLPVILDGREHIDYVPTQVFTEYLRYSFPAPIDGIVFPSAPATPRCGSSGAARRRWTRRTR